MIKNAPNTYVTDPSPSCCGKHTIRDVVWRSKCNLHAHFLLSPSEQSFFESKLTFSEPCLWNEVYLDASKLEKGEERYWIRRRKKLNENAHPDQWTLYVSVGLDDFVVFLSEQIVGEQAICDRLNLPSLPGDLTVVHRMNLIRKEARTTEFGSVYLDVTLFGVIMTVQMTESRQLTNLKVHADHLPPMCHSRLRSALEFENQPWAVDFRSSGGPIEDSLLNFTDEDDEDSAESLQLSLQLSPINFGKVTHTDEKTSSDVERYLTFMRSQNRS